MGKFELVGVQELAFECESALFGAWSVDGIAYDGIADGFKVNANLVCAASLQLQE